MFEQQPLHVAAVHRLDVERERGAATAAALLIAVGYLGWRSLSLERRLAEERGRVAGLNELLARQAVP